MPASAPGGSSRLGDAGARLIFDDAPEILCLPSDRAAYGRLTTLLTLGKRRADKGDCLLHLDDLIAHADGQNLIVLPPPALDPHFTATLRDLKAGLKRPLYLAAHRAGERPMFSTVHGLTAALILAPLLWEMTLRFRLITLPVSSAVLVLFTVLGAGSDLKGEPS